MADGGFLIKFDNKPAERCYKAAFSYDEWTYTVNYDAPKPLPDDVKSITVVIEKGGR